MAFQLVIQYNKYSKNTDFFVFVDRAVHPASQDREAVLEPVAYPARQGKTNKSKSSQHKKANSIFGFRRPSGSPGKPGARGSPGATGAAGKPGARGSRGASGAPGKPG